MNLTTPTCFWHWVAFIAAVIFASTSPFLDETLQNLRSSSSNGSDDLHPIMNFCATVSKLSLLGLPLVVAQYSLINWILNKYCLKWKVQRNVRYTFAQFKLEVFWTIPTFWTVVALFYYMYLHQDSIQYVNWDDFVEEATNKQQRVGEEAVPSPVAVDLGQVERAYWIESIGRTLLFFIFFDLFEYVVHRGFHEFPFFYRQVHKVHHQYRAPSMLTGLAFHPIEALLFFLPVLGLFYWPTHRILFLVAFAAFNLIDLLAHAGFYIPVYEKLTGSFIDTTKHHDYHHQNSTPNYGVYFCIWDRLLGTSSASSPSTAAPRGMKRSADK